MSNIDIATFTDQVEPLGQININGTVYNVYKPDELEERHYIKYFEARAELMDIVKRYSQTVTAADGTTSVVPSSNPGDVLRMEAEMFEPSVRTIEALIQADRKLKILPKTAAKIYNYIESLLPRPEQVQEEDDPLDTNTTESQNSPRKSRSKNTSENS